MMMGNTKTAEAQNQADQPLSRGTKLSYGLGDLSSNLIWTFLSSYLLFFYTDVALIPVAATGTLFLIARVLDAVIDPVVGGFVDRTNTSIGKTKPYIRYGIIPLGILLVITFSYIPGSNALKLVYAYITYILIGIAYSVVNVPYGSLMTLMTRDTKEKAELSSFRVAGAALGSIVITALAMPIVNFMGGGNQRLGFTLTAALIAIVTMIGFEIVAHNCPERFGDTVQEAKSVKKENVFTTYKHALHNRPWIVCVLYSLFFFARIGITIAVTVYFTSYVLKQPGLTSVLLPLTFVGELISTLFSTKVIHRFGHRTTNIIANVGFIVAYLILPFFENNIPLFLIIFLIGNTISAVSAASVFGMNSDSIDYNEWKFGHRSEGTLYAGYSFATKVGMAIGTALTGYALSWIGYQAGHVTPAVVNGLNVMFYAIPIAMSIVMLVTVLFYDLDKKHDQIVKDLNDRN